MAYFAEIARVVKLGGSAWVHLPLYALPSHESEKFARLLELQYQIVLLAKSAQASLQRRRMLMGGKPPMHGVSYDRNKVFQELKRIGFGDIEFRSFPVASTGGLHS